MALDIIVSKEKPALGKLCRQTGMLKSSSWNFFFVSNLPPVFSLCTKPVVMLKHRQCWMVNGCSDSELQE